MLTYKQKNPPKELYEIFERKTSCGEVEFCTNAKGETTWRAAWWKGQELKGAFFDTKDEAMDYIQSEYNEYLRFEAIRRRMMGR